MIARYLVSLLQLENLASDFWEGIFITVLLIS